MRGNHEMYINDHKTTPLDGWGKHWKIEGFSKRSCTYSRDPNLTHPKHTKNDYQPVYTLDNLIENQHKNE